MCKSIRNSLLVLLLIALPAMASSPIEYTKTSGDYVVHFSAMMTSELSAEVARAYQIQRSNQVAMITVNVQHQQEPGEFHAVAADIHSRAANLTGQPRNIRLHQVSEGESIYYVGTLPVANEEIITFTLEITPTHETSPITVRFKRTFYTS